MKIIIDIREHELYEKCCSIVNTEGNNTFIQLEQQTLPLGDILIKTDEDKDVLLIERKTFTDLLASIKDGRYEEQSYRLTHSSNFPLHNIMYLLEGMFSQITNLIEKKIIYSSITSLNYFKGFSVMRTATVRESAEYIVWMANKIEREFQKGKIPSYLIKQTYLSSSVSLLNTSNSIVLQNVNLEEREHEENNEKQMIPASPPKAPMVPKVRLGQASALRLGEPEPLRLGRSGSPPRGEPLEALPSFPRKTSPLRDSVVLQTNEADYCKVVKKIKKDNITKENIGEIILCQIPGISSITAISIMKHFTSFPIFLKELQNNNDLLENLTIEKEGGKSRKIGKNCIENIKYYLL